MSAMAALAAVAVAFTMQTTEPRTIEKGDHSNVDAAMQVLARTEAEYTALYRKHNFDGQPPKVDFAKEMVVAVFMGSRPTAGFNTSIVSATDANGLLVVRYREASPKAGMMTAQILTSPFHLVAIPKADVRDVKFEKIP